MSTPSKRIKLRRCKITRKIMEGCLAMQRARPLAWYVAGQIVKVSDRMQRSYNYVLVFDAGKYLRHGGWRKDGTVVRYDGFRPRYSPQQMLRMGVFEGKYCNDKIFEFPREWYMTASGVFNAAKFSPEAPDPRVNFFGVKSRQNLGEWRRRLWVPCHPSDRDKRGWFEWYCRYWLGRRQPDVDAVQVARWMAFVRHYAQFKLQTEGRGESIHPRRRQALLQWSYPCRG